MYNHNQYNFYDEFNSSFFKKKQSAWDFWKYPVVCVGIALVFWLFMVVAFSKLQETPNKVKLYQIEVNTFGNSTTYLTSEYKIDSITRCIQFVSMGLKKKVCDHYTITTYIE